MIRSFYHHGAETPATDLTPEQIPAALADAGGVLWIDMAGASPEEAERVLKRVFGFHSLSISDCLEGVRQPKLDNYGDYLFFVIYANDRNEPLEEINPVELSIYLGANFVVTHHLHPLPAIDRTAERAMREEQVMNRGADHLVYEILCAVEADFRPTIDALAAAVAGIEVEVLTAPTSNTLRRMYELRHHVLKGRRVLVPQQEVLNRLAMHDLRPIGPNSRMYFQELAEQFAQMAETVDIQREYLRGAMQTHLSVVAGRTHSLLQRVAIMIAILLPLTLLAVLYNSSLRAIPLLSPPYADFLPMGVVLLVALLAVLYFRRA